MGCTLKNFDLLGGWESTQLNGHKVETAKAKYKPAKYRGKVVPSALDNEVVWLYKVDGVFQGSTFGPEGVKYHALQKIADIECELQRQAPDYDPLALPPGYKLITHPATKIRFVCTPDNMLVPNQGGRKKPGPTETDAEIIADFQLWLAKQPKETA